MVQITDYRTYHREDDGEEFYALVVQGGLEAIKSKETGRMYFTAKNATVSCTFNEATCKSLLNTSFPGNIKRVETEPYEYTLESGETIERNHRYEYISEEDDVIDNNIMRPELVH